MYNFVNFCYRLTAAALHDRIVGMKFVTRALQKLGMKKTGRKTLAQYKEELLCREGREQFKKLLRQGLTIPVIAIKN